MKHVKMALYGEPGVGKSTFASKAPNPLFICSDGNFEWLDLPEANGIQLSSWADAKKLFNNDEVLSKYDTIVLDLTEDFFKLCEYEYCARNKLEHLSDLGYGKGYDATRNEFFIEMCKLLNREQNIVLIFHGTTYTIKDRRGVEKTMHGPSQRMPDKVLDMIEGRVRYFLRAYVKDEEHEDGTITKRRWLSLVPKPNEFGIIRGVDENAVPQDIPLDWNEFVNIIGVDTKTEKKVEKKVETVETISETPKETVETVSRRRKKVAEVEETKEDISEKVEEKIEKIEEKTEVVEETKSESTKIESNTDKLASIRARLNAMKAN